MKWVESMNVSDVKVMEMNISRQTLRIDGEVISAGDVHKLEEKVRQNPTSPLGGVAKFLRNWFDESPYLTVHTSGSTGMPKALTVRKEQMIHSARCTCEFLGLRPGDGALLCMDLRYIGAMMMVVRALVAGLNLIVRPPSGHPLADDVEIPVEFAAMVPLQVYNTLGVERERERLGRLKVLIIGGGAVDGALESELRGLRGAVYSTYGMTETLSHIALRRLNGEWASERYHPFPSVGLCLSAEGTLVIDAPLVCDEVLQTNDIARLYPDGSFTILGRKDNVINSGGVKIQAEEVERQLGGCITVPFAITSVPDKRLGQAVTLLMEHPSDGADIETRIALLLPPYHRPQHIWVVDRLPQTGNGKTDRPACQVLAQRLLLQKGNEKNR